MASFLGYTIIFFYLLASTNALKRYTKNKVIRWIARRHQTFGGIAALVALVHLIVNVSNGLLSPTGLLTLILLFATIILGALFKQLKAKPLYIAHRILGPLVLLSALLHIFL